MADSPRLILLMGVVLIAGLALVLTELRWFRRPSLARRLSPYAKTAEIASSASGWASMRVALLPTVDNVGNKLSSLLGLNGDLASRLRRAHDPRTVSAVRMRQLGLAVAGLVFAGLLVAAIQPPAMVGFFFLVGLPVLAFLVIEQQVSSAADRRAQRVFSELPVMAEQMAMLLGAGYSLGSAVARLADRGDGAVSQDLKRVRDRNRQGIPVEDALVEWSENGGPELKRLVTVIRTGSTSGDLSRLVSEEAKSLRKEAQRRLSETIEKRAQQVWIPVTVATLVPGVIFLCIPFLQALSLFSGA